MVVHEILRQNVEQALQSLEATQISDEDIHRARKELKKARAALRLLRDGLRPAQYRRWNTNLRDAARPLSATRDARVLLDSLQRLRKNSGTSDPKTLGDELARSLKREHLEAGRRVRNTAEGIPHSRALLRGVRRQIERAAVEERRAVLGKGLRRVYSHGRKAMRTAQARDPDALHDWRKQTKYLWHQLQILEPLRPGVIGELADQAHQLADYLGDDHDLSVLRARITQSGSGEADVGRSALGTLIESRQDQLREKALLLGHRLYEEKPKAFAARFGEYWKHSRREQTPTARRLARAADEPPRRP
jgi:CHAD domain-containing protein